MTNLRNIDKQAIEDILHREPNKENILLSNKFLEDIFQKFNCQEFTEHWYDSDPQQCASCSQRPCTHCQIWDEWQKSEEILKLNTWIDVWGPGIWGQTQEDANEYAIECLKEFINLGDIQGRVWKVLKDGYMQIYCYNRDREQVDYWVVLKAKE